MLHVIDNLLPTDVLQELRDLCDIHGRLKEQHSGDAQFSWRPETGAPRTIHAPVQQAVIDRYLDDALLPLATAFAPQRAGVEWWCNTNNDLDWHIGKDELEGRSGRFVCRCCQRVLSPRQLCWRRTSGGRQPLRSTMDTRPPAHIPLGDLDPPVNRLVLFSPGTCIGSAISKASVTRSP